MNNYNSYSLLFGSSSTNSNVDKLLLKPDVTLKELLEEEGIIQEFKNQNEKLMSFINHS